MPDSSSSSKSTKKTRKPATRRRKSTVVSKPAASLPPLLAPTPAPEHATATAPPPSVAPPLPLVRTSYNANRIKRLSWAGGLAIVMLIGAVGWLYRDQLLALLPTTDRSPAPAYHLQVEPERLDEEKLSQALQQAGISPPSASTSAQSSDSATPAYVAEYTNTTDQELHERLEAGIAALDNTEPYVGVLAAYKAKINQLESTNPAKARQALMEAVQLSKEFTALYLYAKE